MFENEPLPGLMPPMDGLTATEKEADDLTKLQLLSHRFGRLKFWFGFTVGFASGCVVGIAGLCWFLSQ
jgi:hypothetical protein